jgi:hypothetical protein
MAFLFIDKTKGNVLFFHCLRGPSLAAVNRACLGAPQGAPFMFYALTIPSGSRGLASLKQIPEIVWSNISLIPYFFIRSFGGVSRFSNANATQSAN